jgi:hypothetical protein
LFYLRRAPHSGLLHPRDPTVVDDAVAAAQRRLGEQNADH